MSTLQTTILKHPDSASNNIQVDANGDVGIKNSASSLIGAVTNAATLVVGDGASSEGITIYTGASNAGELAFADGIVGSATQRGRILYSHGDNSMRISTNGAEHVRILNNGNFGIGESSPQYKLHVKDGSGTAYRNLAWFQGKGTHATAGFERAVALGASNAGAHIDGWNGTSGSRGETFLLLQSAGGNVAIGTSSAYSASGYNSLTLNGSTGSQIRFRTGDSDKGLIYNTANDFNIFSFDNPLRFHTNSTERLRILTDGTIRLASGCPGIDFSQIQTNASGMTSETLDSYETGTWTPAAFENFNGITSPEGVYEKIGNVVTIVFQFNYSSLNNASAASAVEGLPFDVHNFNSLTGVEATGTVFGTGKIVLAYANSGGDKLYFETDRPLTGSTSSGADFFRGSLTYLAG